MSKLTRTLVVGATLAAMNLAGMTAVAQAHVTAYTIKPYASSPLEPRAGESYRNPQVAPEKSQTTIDPAAQRALARQRYRYYQSTRTSLEQTAALRRVLAQEHSSIPSGTPAQVTAPAPAEPSGQPGRLIASLGVLAPALALVAGLAVLAARRARRRARVGHAA
jgi:hypothetical protein